MNTSKYEAFAALMGCSVEAVARQMKANAADLRAEAAVAEGVGVRKVRGLTVAQMRDKAAALDVAAAKI